LIFKMSFVLLFVFWLSGYKDVMCSQIVGIPPPPWLCNELFIYLGPEIDLSPYEWNFDLDMPGQKFHHSLKEHHKISNITKFRCEML
jgi:hypothetical protein